MREFSNDLCLTVDEETDPIHFHGFFHLLLVMYMFGLGSNNCAFFN